MTKKTVTWEEAVDSLRLDPKYATAVLDNYFESDLIASCNRFMNSEEFIATLKVLNEQNVNRGKLLDIGAGRGIASYAFAKNGFQVTALEPDPSKDVGYEAIRLIASASDLDIKVNIEFGENLPFDDQSFDVVYARQVLHHAYDLPQFMKEVGRVLKPGGTFIATREHIIDSESDKEIFLKNHALHYLYGGENAFLFQEYKNSIVNGGLHLTKVLKSYDSVINYFPTSAQELEQKNTAVLSRYLGKSIGTSLGSLSLVQKLLNGLRSSFDKTPGRLYSFIASKP